MALAHRYSRYFTYIQPVIKAPLVKTYGSLILTIVTLSVFTIFAIKPTVETILILQKKLSDQKAVLTALNQKSQDLSLGANNYKTLINQGTKDKIDFAIPFSPTIGSLTSSLEDVARVPQASISAIQFESFTITPATKSANFSLVEIPFTYNIEGSYQSLIEVMENLKNSGRLVSVESMNFNKLEGGGLLLTVTGKAFYLK